MDAVQNNPSIDGSLRNEVNKLKTESPIIIRDFKLENVTITSRSGSVYFGEIDNFFTNNGIDVNKVMSLNIVYWQSASSPFNVYMYAALKKLGFMSSTAQTLPMVTIRVAYLK